MTVEEKWKCDHDKMSLELPIYIKIRAVELGLKYYLTISIKLGQIKHLGSSHILNLKPSYGISPLDA